MKSNSQGQTDSPKWLTAEIERVLKFLSHFPADGQPKLSSLGNDVEPSRFNERALKLYIKMHFSGKSIPEPPIISELPDQRTDLYALLRWCVTVWPTWKELTTGPQANAPADGESSQETLGDGRSISGCSHSIDFRSVRWYGKEYAFTAQQAAAVKILWTAWENGTPEVGQEYICTEIESESRRLRGVFEGGRHPAWGNMIVPGTTKGAFRLVSPPKT